MSCDMASPAGSSYQGSIFDDEWKNFGGDMSGLDAVAAFNASLDGDDGSNGQAHGWSVDPQLLSNAPSPTSNHVSFEQTHGLPFGSDGGGGNMFDMYSSPAVQSSASSAVPSPYFHHSIEHLDRPMPQRPIYAPSHLRHQVHFHHRRSISEPPDQYHLPNHLLPPQPSDMMPTFTRSGMSLGTPRPQHPPVPRSGARVKQPPYPPAFSVVKRQVPRQERYQPRRTQTQPLRPPGGPTSVPPEFGPSKPYAPQGPSTLPLLPPQFLDPFAAPRVVSSRVCTPRPSPEQAEPAQFDPIATEPKQRNILIPVTVEELKTMISDAVRSAVKEVVAETGVKNSKPEPPIPTNQEVSPSEELEVGTEGAGNDMIHVEGKVEAFRSSIELFVGDEMQIERD